MNDQFILDLGEDYGEILVEGISSTQEVQEGLVQAGIADETINYIRVKVKDVLQAPLTGMGLALRASLPNSTIMDNDQFEFDEYVVQFQLGITAETGMDIGAVAKIIPNGSFNFTYKWKRKSIVPKKD